MAPKGSIVVGEQLRTLDPTPRGVVTLDLEALSRHVAILGTTGSGKSTCAAMIARELGALGKAVVVLDRTGEYVELLRSAAPAVLTPGSDFAISPFDPRGKFDHERTDEWISLLEHYSRVSFGVGLSPLQNRVLRDALESYFHGTQRPLPVRELVRRLQEAEDELFKLRGWVESIEALVSKLWPLTHGAIGRTLDAQGGGFETTSLFGAGVKVVDLSGLPDDRAKNMLSQLLLKEVYEETRKRGRTEALRLVMVIDEAQNLAPVLKDYTSIPERCAMELRKYGFSLVVCASRPSLLSQNVIANSNTLICHMLNNETDLEAAAGFFVGSNVKDSLRRLPVGVGMLQVNHPEPKDAVRVRIDTDGQRKNVLGDLVVGAFRDQRHRAAEAFRPG
ncbi:MAG: ATP-binding protein [Nitrososphaerota archaeon]|nr:ATP-binding protein [Nitrososphaerota archaeon]